MKKLAFFLGKGGVGKTTISSTTAFQLSQQGYRTLICSLDPAHNVGDIFQTKLTNSITPIANQLDGIEVDLETWVRTYLEESKREIQTAYRYNAVIDVSRYLDIMKYAPGTEEYAVLWAIEHIYTTWKSVYDIIIFDTPPTALALRFLAMPALSSMWIKELSSLRKTLLEKRNTLLKLNPEANVLGGQVKKEDDPIYQKLGSIQQRLNHLQKLFAAESYINIVLNPDELSFSESLRIRTELEKLGVPIASLSYNKYFCRDEREVRVKKTFKGMPIFTLPCLDGNSIERDDLVKFDVSQLIEHIRSY